MPSNHNELAASLVAQYLSQSPRNADDIATGTVQCWDVGPTSKHLRHEATISAKSIIMDNPLHGEKRSRIGTPGGLLLQSCYNHIL